MHRTIQRTIQRKPVFHYPADFKFSDAKAVNAKSVDAGLADTKPVDAKPADVKRADADSKSATKKVNFHVASGIRYAKNRNLLMASVNVDGVTALMSAAKKGSVDDVLFFLKEGADVSAVDDFGWTALMYAARNGHADVAKIIIEKDLATLTAENKTKDTFFEIVRMHQPENVKLQSLVSLYELKGVRELVGSYW